MAGFINSFKRFILIIVILVAVTFGAVYIFNEFVAQQTKLSVLLRETIVTVILVIFSLIMIFLIRHSKLFISKRVGVEVATVFQFLMVLIVIIVMVFTIFNVFQVEVTALLLGGSIISIISGLAISTFVGNVLSGLMLFTTNPIRPGDTVTVNNVPGKIVEITAMVTRIRNGFGGESVIPNTAIVQGGVIITKYPSEEVAVRSIVPYTVGDRVYTTYMNAEGMVKELTLFHTKILLDSGKELTFLHSSMLQGTTAVAKVTGKPGSSTA